MHQPLHWIEALIAHYGLLAVLAGSMLEGETVVTLAGFAAHQHLLNPLFVAPVAMAGAFAADQAIFWLAHSNRDRPFVRRLADSRAGRIAIGAVAARPTWFILAFRFMIGLRTVGPVAIALAGVTPGRFALLNAVSAVVWGAVWTTLGFCAGEAVERLLGDLSRIEHRAMVGLAIIAVVGAFGWVVRHHILRQRPR
ncbi:MAG: DedA family protein [Paracoccaceae bacterium]